jgi:hypothetical protein
MNEGICSFSERFEMVISSNPGVDTLTLPQTSLVPPAEAPQRRQLIQAAKTVNESGFIGKNQIVFSVDRATIGQLSASRIGKLMKSYFSCLPNTCCAWPRTYMAILHR